MADHKYLLIVNPEAGSRQTMKALPDLEAELRKRDADFEFHFTKDRGHATELVKEIGGDFDVVVSVGGDGTINEIVNGMPDLDKPLGMIPIGTGNDFARSCSIPLNQLGAAVDILMAHDVKHIDIGEVNGRRFVNAMGMGFEGRANDIGAKLGFLRGALKYLVAIGFVYFSYKRVPLKIRFNDVELDEPVFIIAVGNGWNVGGGLQLCPRAKLDDGLFDIGYVRFISRWRIIVVFKKLYDGSIKEIPEYEAFQTTTLSIESDKHIPAHMDGEVIPPVADKFEIKLLPAAQAIIGNWGADTRFGEAASGQ